MTKDEMTKRKADLQDELQKYIMDAQTQIGRYQGQIALLEFLEKEEETKDAPSPP